MHASILKARGCAPVIVADVSQERLDYVTEFGLGLTGEHLGRGRGQ